MDPAIIVEQSTQVIVWGKLIPAAVIPCLYLVICVLSIRTRQPAPKDCKLAYACEAEAVSATAEKNRSPEAAKGKSSTRKTMPGELIKRQRVVKRGSTAEDVHTAF